MKKSQTFKGLPVVDIEQGSEIGKVKELIIHPKKRDLMGLLVEDEQWWKEVKVISFPLIYGMGEYAVTVQNRQCLVLLKELPEIEKTLTMRVHPIHSKVITRAGVLLGEVTEFYLDPQSGKVKAYEIVLTDSEESKDTTVVLPAHAVLTLGKDVVVVSDDAQKAFSSSVEQVEEHIAEAPMPEPKPTFVEEKPSAEIETALKPEPVAPKKEEKKEAAVEEKKVASAEEAVPEEPEEKQPEIEQKEVAAAPPQAEEEELAAEQEEVAEPAKESAPSAPAKAASSFANQFIERIKKTLIGKTVKRDVAGPDGSLLVKKGDVITLEVLEKAASDRKLLTQLNFAVK